jgi:hypothetical protein
MRTYERLCVVVVIVAALLTCYSVRPVLAVNDEPLNDTWAPSQWGPDDKAGAVNRTTPEMVLKSVKLVKRGKVATLGKVYQQDAPTFGSRGWRMTIPGLPTGGPFGPQELVYNDEYLATEIGQIGTQFDGPGHMGVITSKGMFFYNGRFLEDADVGTYGLGPLGVEHVAKIGFVCRGVLLDAVALRGGQLPIPKENNRNDPGIITDEDIKEMVRLIPLAKGIACFCIPVTVTSGTRHSGILTIERRRPNGSLRSTLVSLVSVFPLVSIWPHVRLYFGGRIVGALKP